MAAYVRAGSLTSWQGFLDALDDFENIVAAHWDSDESHDIPSRFSTLGLNLADWIAKHSPHDPAPLLDLMRAVAAKDPLGPMTAFKASVEEVDRLRWRWWPIKELLVDRALAEIEGGKPPADNDGPCGVYRWRHAGEVVEGKMQPQTWKLAEALFKRLGEKVRFDTLIGPDRVFTDELTDDQAIQRQGSRVNQWFRDRDIPLVVSSSTVDRAIWMEIAEIW